MYALYVTHPQVAVDPAVPVPGWGLTELGRERAGRFARHPLVRGVTRIVSSPETKALQLAQLLSLGCGAPVESGENFGENDRSTTGFVPPARFELLADSFFAHPDESVEGWETARAAQRRIVGAFATALAGHDPARPVAFAGHGAVGTLLKCHLAGRPITRAEDQHGAGPGGGNVFCIRLRDRALLTGWLAMETLPAVIDGL